MRLVRLFAADHQSPTAHYVAHRQQSHGGQSEDLHAARSPVKAASRQLESHVGLNRSTQLLAWNASEADVEKVEL